MSLSSTAAENRHVMPMPSWVKKVTPAPSFIDQTIVEGQESVTGDTVPLMKRRVYKNLAQTRELARRLKGSTKEQTARNYYNFIVRHIRYVLDPDQVEQVRDPARTIYDGKGDCDCMVVLLSSMLLNAGIPHYLRIMKEFNDHWSHTYVVIPKNGKSLKRRSDYLAVDPVTHRFDYEAPHSETKDTFMALQSLQGIGRANGCPTEPLVERIRRFAFNDQIRDSGLIPTEEFLKERGIAYVPTLDTERNAGAVMITTPSGPLSIPTILSAAGAEQLLDRVMPAASRQTITTAAPEIKPAEIKSAGVGNGWLWYAIAGGMVLYILTHQDTEKPPSLQGIKRSKRSAPRKMKRLKV